MPRRMWIAVERHLVSRDIVGHAAEFLSLAPVHAMGHLIAFWGEVAEDARGGDVSGIRDSVIERWAQWDGEAGLFAEFVRQHCVTEGVINGWDEMQGSLEDRKKHDRDRKRAWRERGKVSPESPGTVPVDVPVTSRGTVQDSTGQTTSSSSARETLVLSMQPMSQIKFAAEENMWRNGAHLAPGLCAIDADIEIACSDWLQAHPNDLPSPIAMRKFVETAIRERMSNAARPAPEKPIGTFPRPNGRVTRAEQTYRDARLSVGLPAHPEDDRVVT